MGIDGREDAGDDVADAVVGGADHGLGGFAEVLDGDAFAHELGAEGEAEVLAHALARDAFDGGEEGAGGGAGRDRAAEDDGVVAVLAGQRAADRLGHGEDVAGFAGAVVAAGRADRDESDVGIKDRRLRCRS